MAFDLDDESIALLGGGGASASEHSPAPEGSVRVPSGAGKDQMIAGDAFEGASRISESLARYRPKLDAPDQEIRPAKQIADARSRDLDRNDANIQSGVRLRQDAVVGSYLMLNARPNSSRLFGKEDVKWEDEFSEEVEERFAAYAESEDNWVDASGRLTLTGMARQAVEQHTLHGEVLATVEWKRESDRPFNTAVQMVHIDRLRTPTDRAMDKNISMGVQMDPTWGSPVGYHILMAHPSDWKASPQNLEFKYCPAKLPWGRKQVLHLYTPHQPGATRGIGTMVAAIPEIKMARQFRELVLQNAILNATYAATVESDLDPAMIFQSLGGTDFAPEEVQEALQSYMLGQYAALDTVLGSNLKLGGLKVPVMPAGTKLELRGAGNGGPLGTDFEASLNRLMASALGLSYEQYSRDYTKTNYSSGKMASVETYKAMLSIKRVVADAFATSVYRLWFEEALNKGVFTSVRRSMPSFYENGNKEWYCGCDWIGASRGQIDELKETQSAVMRMNNNISTLQDESARLGKDWRRILRQRKREQDWKEFYGLNDTETDTTSQTNAASGTKREKKVASSTASFVEDKPEAVNE